MEGKILECFKWGFPWEAKCFVPSNASECKELGEAQFSFLVPQLVGTTSVLVHRVLFFKRKCISLGSYQASLGNYRTYVASCFCKPNSQIWLFLLFEMEWGICCSDKFDCQLYVGLFNIIILVTHSLRNSSRKKMALSAIFKLGQ